MFHDEFNFNFDVNTFPQSNLGLGGIRRANFLGLIIGALLGGLAGGAALTGTIGTALTVGGLTAGALVGGGIDLFREGQKKTKIPGATIEFPEVPRLTVEEIEAGEMGWAQILQRAKGRRGTILTQPQLAQIQPHTERATLLAG